MRRVELRVDVSEAGGLGAPMSSAVTVHLPGHHVRTAPVVVALPGGGYGRRYYDLQLAAAGLGAVAPGRFSQAEHHVERGMVVVTVDHLGTGDSDAPADPFALDVERLAAANHAATAEVLRHLTAGTLAADRPPINPSVVVGMGQSMGGCLLTVQQALHRTFDAVALLGWSNVWSSFPDPAGGRVAVDVPRRHDDLRTATLPALFDDDLFRYCFHYGDVPAAVVDADLGGTASPWRSAAAPMCAMTMLSEGVVAEEAAVIDVPVLVASGERDVVPDPHAEPRAYPSSNDVTVVVIASMAHMHNFAGTRARLWDRLAVWVEGLAPVASRHPAPPVPTV